MALLHNLVLVGFIFAVPSAASTSECSKASSASSSKLLQIDANHVVQQKVMTTLENGDASKTGSFMSAQMGETSIRKKQSKDHIEAGRKSKTRYAGHTSKSTNAHKQRSRSNLTVGFTETSGKCASRDASNLHFYKCTFGTLGDYVLENEEEEQDAEGDELTYTLTSNDETYLADVCQKAGVAFDEWASGATAWTYDYRTVAYTYPSEDISGDADQEVACIVVAGPPSWQTSLLELTGAKTSKKAGSQRKTEQNGKWGYESDCPWSFDVTDDTGDATYTCCMTDPAEFDDTFSDDCEEASCSECISADTAQDWVCAMGSSAECSATTTTTTTTGWSQEGEYQKCTGCSKSSSTTYYSDSASCMAAARAWGWSYASWRPDKQYCCMTSTCTPADTTSEWYYYHFSGDLWTWR